MARSLISLIYFLRLGRPLFLIGGFLLYGLGVVVALYDGAALHLGALLWGQVVVTATQVMTHYSNDYFDLAADRANPTPTRWSGGSRILPEGHIAPRLALAAALVAATVAVGGTLLLVVTVETGPLALPLLLLAVFLGWNYSSPPLQLHSRGVGEVAGAVLVAGMTPLVGYYLQAGRLTLLPILAVIPLALLQFMMLLLIEFPDARGDALAGKKTMVVVLGGRRAARLLQGTLLLFFLVLPLLVLGGLPVQVAWGLALFTLPGATWLLWRLEEGRWAQPAWWNWLGFVGVAHVVGASTLAFVVFAWLALVA